MSTSDVQPSLPDWQELLVEAIQQRDSHRAVMLAQRCVHRYGMPTLEALLEKANAGAFGGSQGDARSWLLPLLTQPSLAPDPGESPEVPLKEPGLATWSAKLDEAFAPLEIAFPPLPILGVVAPEADGPPAQSLAHPDPKSGVRSEEAIRLMDPTLETLEVSALEALAEEPDESQTAEEAVVAQIGRDLMETQAGQEAAEELVGFQLLEADLAQEEAAPVPTFELEDPPLRQPSTRKVRHSERRGTIPPAPISPALEPWLAWLPGAHRPGARP